MIENLVIVAYVSGLRWWRIYETEGARRCFPLSSNGVMRRNNVVNKIAFTAFLDANLHLKISGEPDDVNGNKFIGARISYSRKPKFHIVSCWRHNTKSENTRA
jgi:hypothetical protein